MNWYKSKSTVKPDEIDITSSKTTVYLRKNIIEKQYESTFGDEIQTYYEYDEAKLTKNEYSEYMKGLSIIDIEQQRADIDYLAIMTGISLDEV